MLTLREPIKLICTETMLSLPESFGERVRAAYELMTANFSPRDLVYLLVSPPEAPYIEGAMTSVTVDNQALNTQNILLDVLNNVTNRVLVENQSALTYQDRVYIENILNKLGVADIRSFMAQVRALHEENTSIFRLLSLYQQHTRVAAKPAALPEREAAVAPVAGQPPDEAAREIRLYLHNEIYRRLDTATIYGKFSRYMRNQLVSAALLERRELLVAEQSKIASLLTLQQHRDRLTLAQGEQLLIRSNRYETGEMLPVPATEKEIMERVASAALLNIIGNVMVSRVEQQLRGGDIWVTLSHAARETAANVIKRFMAFHDQHNAYLSVMDKGYTRLSALYEREMSILSRLAEAKPPTAARALIRDSETLVFAEGAATEQPAATPPQAPARQELLRQLSEIRRERARLEISLQSSALSTSVTRDIPYALAADAAPAELSAALGRDFEAKTMYEQRISATGSLEHIVAEHEASAVTGDDMRRHHMPDSVLPYDAPSPGQISAPAVVEDLQLTPSAAAEQEDLPELIHAPGSKAAESGQERIDRDGARALETERRETAAAPATPQDIAPPTTPVSPASADKLVLPPLAAAATTETLLRETLERILEPEPSAAAERSSDTFSFTHSTAAGEALTQLYQQEGDTIYSGSETAGASAATEETVIRDRLAEIDRLNRERLEHIRATLESRETVIKPSAPDRQRILRDALRAIEQPELVLAEARQDAESAGRTGITELDTILTHADETSRQIFEAVKRYSENHEIAAGSLLAVRRAEPLMFNRDAAEAGAYIEQPLPSGLTECPGENSDSAANAYQRLLAEAMPTAITTARGGWEETLNFVHKQTQTRSEQEMAEILESSRQSTQAVINETAATITENRVVETQVNQIMQEIRAKSAEEITDIINKTLARQMGHISDRVYTQLEKRLQSERARRGR